MFALERRTLVAAASLVRSRCKSRKTLGSLGAGHKLFIEAIHRTYQ